MILDCYKPTFARNFIAASSQVLTCGTTPITSWPMTLACWFFTTDLVSNQTLMALANPASTLLNDRFELRFNQSGDRVAMTSADTVSSAVFTTTSARANLWHHACGVVTAANARTVQLDGGGKDNASGSSTPVGVSQIQIGGLVQATSGQFMSGRIRWPGMWNVALTDAEIAQLVKGIHPSLIRPESLVAFWDWDGHETEYGLRGDYPLINSGSTPIFGPGFLQTRIPRPWLLGSGQISGGGSNEGEALITLSNVTANIDGTLSIVGTVLPTLGNTIIDSDSALAISGSAELTLNAINIATETSLSISGSVSKTLDSIVLNSSASIEVSGTAASTLDAITANANSILSISGSASPTLDDTTLVSGNDTSNSGTSTILLTGVSLSSNGSSSIVGSGSQTFDNATATATGLLSISGSLNETFDNVILDSTDSTGSLIVQYYRYLLGA